MIINVIDVTVPFPGITASPPTWVYGCVVLTVFACKVVFCFQMERMDAKKTELETAINTTNDNMKDLKDHMKTMLDNRVAENAAFTQALAGICFSRENCCVRILWENLLSTNISARMEYVIRTDIVLYSANK